MMNDSIREKRQPEYIPFLWLKNFERGVRRCDVGFIPLASHGCSNDIGLTPFVVALHPILPCLTLSGFFLSLVKVFHTIDF
jgi:hypothetical protein